VTIAWLIALPLGIWSAARSGRWASRASDGATSVLLTLPELLVALLFLLVALRTGWFPTGGMTSPGADELGALARLRDLAAHAALPMTALVVATVPMLLRHVRAAAAESYSAPAVAAARGHGIGPVRLALRYVLPMSAAPLVSLAGLSIATLLSVSLLTEVVMSWPGLGPLVVEAMLARDLYVIVAAALLSTLFVLAGNLAADAALVAVDPRIRRQ
jgi:peptide/nickel transport system permease protein